MTSGDPFLDSDVAGARSARENRCGHPSRPGAPGGGADPQAGGTRLHLPQICFDRVQGSGFRVQGSGFRVDGTTPPTNLFRTVEEHTPDPNPETLEVKALNL